MRWDRFWFAVFSWRNANLAGGFAGRLVVGPGLSFGWIGFACFYGPTVSFYKCFLTTYSHKNRASERHRPNGRKKRLPFALPRQLSQLEVPAISMNQTETLRSRFINQNNLASPVYNHKIVWKSRDPSYLRDATRKPWGRQQGRKTQQHN